MYITSVWQVCNKELHKTDRLEDMEGKKEIMKTIKQEYKVGLGRLPAYRFSYILKKKETEILQKSQEHINHLLAIVKQGSILYHGPNWIGNEFSYQGSLYIKCNR